ncbi:hypothetical protein [Cupriavidus oxalaticus]|uniref:Signal peptide protein n=1 Tax=Cupriavidus oxalaticus TaxID=96344 RepID=A0A375GSJ9_9BURK|nr:hypothetical protein [Cupriavidus oxalaticus]QEZ42825.1 hypothetical protein D2917_00295 [Cupriavidus oxalaticus]QRQ83568.1 hypothetical protein JTE91_06925 [Cupriavidus oxalaticus]QRQ92343.1 hypothetical protein JTE92_05420 [Cupriavidus oxalaticus]WQD86957.1 hypothetical protein U0036_23530 [Cupriavidus oxalaticus]SPC24924.1 Signal peptide protein [Cupriavidus oxalaticus]
MRTRHTPISASPGLASLAWVAALLLPLPLHAAPGPVPARNAAAASAPAPAVDEAESLSRMLKGAATGQNTGAAGVPELLRSTTRPDSVLARACRQLNDALPIEIDGETRLRRCQSVPGKHVLFQLELTNYRGPMLDLASFEVNYAAPLQRNICANRDVEILTKLGVSLMFRYMTRKDRGERRIGDVYINAPICTSALR